MALDYTITFAGLTIGNGTPFQLMNIDGIENLPDIRVADSPRGGRDGEFSGLDLLAGRDITIDLVIFDSGVGDYFTNIELFKAMSLKAASESIFTFQLPGRTSRQLMARARRRSLPVAQDYQFRYGAASVQFHATDPRIYDSTLTQVSTSLPTSSGGLSFAAAAPFVFGSGGTGGSLAAPNIGTYEAPYVIVFTGPLVAPSLEHVAQGKKLDFAGGSLAAGETLVVDSLSRTALLNGTASRYSWLTSLSQWFTLAPGANGLRFAGASGAGSVQISYRSAWL